MDVLLIHVSNFVSLTVVQQLLRSLFSLTTTKLKVRRIFIQLSTFVVCLPPTSTCSAAVRNRNISKRNVGWCVSFGLSAGRSCDRWLFGGHQGQGCRGAVEVWMGMMGVMEPAACH